MPQEPNLRSSRRQRTTHSDSPDRLPPHSPEVEQSLLGCILLEPQVVLPQCIEQISPATFYDLRNQEIYQTMLELFEDNAPVEVVALVDRLQTWGKLESVGGMSYVATLPDSVATTADAEYFIGVLRDRASERQMIRVCTEIVGRIYDRNGTQTAELMDECEREVLRAAESRSTQAAATTPELVRSAVTNIENAYQREGHVSGLATGFADLDAITQGLRPGHMIVIAARPSMGKTSLAMNIAEHVAVDSQIPVGVFSLEMTGEELIERMIASRARVNLRSIQRGYGQDRHVPQIVAAAEQISRAPLYIEDAGNLSILQIRAKARRWHQQHQIRLAIIDYLQLANATGSHRKFENRQQEVSDISAGVKALAKELHVPVIVLSQLNREIEREKRRPRLSDLRESGSIEQDADLVGFLWRLDRTQGNEDDEGGVDESAQRIGLLVAKQRGGPTGIVPLVFLKHFTRFESASRIPQDEAPPAAAPQQSLPYNDT